MAWVITGSVSRAGDASGDGVDEWEGRFGKNKHGLFKVGKSVNSEYGQVMENTWDPDLVI